MILRKKIFLVMFVAVLLASLTNCPIENYGNGQAGDGFSPTVGSPTLTISNQTNSSLRISWAKASDDISRADA